MALRLTYRCWGFVSHLVSQQLAVQTSLGLRDGASAPASGVIPSQCGALVLSACPDGCSYQGGIAMLGTENCWVAAGGQHLLVGPAEPSGSDRPLKSRVCLEAEEPFCSLLA